MKITGVSEVIIGKERLQRIEYLTEDNLADWALIRTPDKGTNWVVCIHGHGSNGDQLYVRQDVRDLWLPEFVNMGFGILTPNLRGNAWMNRLAVQDVSEFLDFLREEWMAEKFMFASGSMGGTSNLIYASQRPEDVAAVVALGAASDLNSYVRWCRERNTGVIAEIADAIESAYGIDGNAAAACESHSVLTNSAKLTMPVFVVHGSNDELIPVSQMRMLCGRMGDSSSFVYAEVPDGDHDSPLYRTDAFRWAAGKAGMLS